MLGTISPIYSTGIIEGAINLVFRNKNVSRWSHTNEFMILPSATVRSGEFGHYLLRTMI